MSHPRRYRGIGLTLALLAFTLLLAAGGADAAEQSASVRLKSTNDSTIKGRVKIEQIDGLTTLTVSVTGSTDPLLPYVRRGSCTAYRQQPAIPLALATAEAPSVTTVDIPFDSLMSGSYVVDLHIAQGDIASLLDPATSVACGVLATAASTAGTTTATAAPTATPEPATVAPVAGAGPFSNAQVAGLTLGLLIAGGGACLLTGMRLRRPAVFVRARVARRRLRGVVQ